MKPCLCQLVNSGVHPDTPSRKAGYIRASNTTALVIGLWLLSIMAISTPILIDVWGWYTAANILVSLICLLVVTFNALHLGRDPWDHLFLLAMVLIAFQYMESRKVIVGTLVGPTLMQRPAPPRRVQDSLDAEKQRSEKLLLNILPAAIADAYMVAAGLPEPRPDHAAACLAMARAMLAHRETVRKTFPTLQVRIGIHTGPVIAGVIGRIHVSDAFRQELGPDISAEDRGIIEIKGQDPQRTYLIT